MNPYVYLIKDKNPETPDRYLKVTQEGKLWWDRARFVAKVFRERDDAERWAVENLGDPWEISKQPLH